MVGVVESLDDFEVALERRGGPCGELARVRGHGAVIGVGRRESGARVHLLLMR